MVDMTGLFVGTGGAAVVAVESARPAIVASFPIRIGRSYTSTGLTSSGRCRFDGGELGKGGDQLRLGGGELGGKGLNGLRERNHGGTVGGGGGC